MIKRVIILLSILFPMMVLASPGPDYPIALLHVKINSSNKASLVRGAKFFAQNCLVCHTMRYVEHDEIAKQAGITLDKMPLKNQEWWLNIVPPDLSLIARIRGANWLYTYFHSFYRDPGRPTGYNNLVAENINMTNIFLPFQGEQVLVPQYQSALDKHFGYRKPQYYTVLKLVRAGSMTPEQFDSTMTDLVNFLVYVSEPHKAQREALGFWVILFLIIFAVFTYLLKRVYWKNVK